MSPSMRADLEQRDAGVVGPRCVQCASAGVGVEPAEQVRRGSRRSADPIADARQARPVRRGAVAPAIARISRAPPPRSSRIEPRSMWSGSLRTRMISSARRRSGRACRASARPSGRWRTERARCDARHLLEPRPGSGWRAAAGRRSSVGMEEAEPAVGRVAVGELLLQLEAHVLGPEVRVGANGQLDVERHEHAAGGSRGPRRSGAAPRDARRPPVAQLGDEHVGAGRIDRSRTVRQLPVQA